MFYKPIIEVHMVMHNNRWYGFHSPWQLFSVHVLVYKCTTLEVKIKSAVLWYISDIALQSVVYK